MRTNFDFERGERISLVDVNGKLLSSVEA